MNLFKCEKRRKFHVSSCLFNLPIFVAIICVTFVCHFEYRVNWHAKSLQSKALRKFAPECQKKKLQEHDINVQKKERAKIDKLNLKKSTRKNWLVNSPYTWRPIQLLQKERVSCWHKRMNSVNFY